MTNLVKWGSYELETAQEEKQESDASGAGADFMKLVAGKNVVRFLPPKVGQRTPFIVVYQHYVKMPGLTSPAVFACPRMMKKEPCGACAKAEELKATGNPADADMAKDLFASRRVFANVINRANPEDGPRILGFGKMIHEALLAIRADEDAGGDYTHPVEGFDIVIEKSGEKLNTKYTVRPARQSTPLATDDQQMQDWIDMQHNLAALARVPTREEMQKLFGSSAGGGGGQRRGGPRRASAQDDIETDSEEA
jgi:hypothetical protein